MAKGRREFARKEIADLPDHERWKAAKFGFPDDVYRAVNTLQFGQVHRNVIAKAPGWEDVEKSKRDDVVRMADEALSWLSHRLEKAVKDGDSQFFHDMALEVERIREGKVDRDAMLILDAWRRISGQWLEEAGGVLAGIRARDLKSFLGESWARLKRPDSELYRIAKECGVPILSRGASLPDGYDAFFRLMRQNSAGR